MINILPHTSQFIIDCHLSFDFVYSELLMALLNKLQINLKIRAKALHVLSHIRLTLSVLPEK